MEEEERVEQQQRAHTFQGAGFKLGDSEGPSQTVGSRSGLPSLPKPPEKVS